jgi:hypothetical protein
MECHVKGTWQCVVGDSRGCLTYFSPLEQLGKLCLDEDMFHQDPNFHRLTGITCMESVTLECEGGLGVDFIVCCMGDSLVFVRGLRREVTLKLPCNAYAVWTRRT